MFGGGLGCSVIWLRGVRVFKLYGGTDTRQGAFGPQTPCKWVYMDHLGGVHLGFRAFGFKP